MHTSVPLAVFSWVLRLFLLGQSVAVLLGRWPPMGSSTCGGLSPDVSSHLLMLCWDIQATCHPRYTWICQPGRAALLEPSPDKSIPYCALLCKLPLQLLSVHFVQQVQLTLPYGFLAGRADTTEA